MRLSFLMLTATLCLVFIACQQPVNSEGLQEYLSNPDHGLLKVHQAGLFKAELMYQPANLFAQRAFPRDTSLTKSLADSIIAAYSANMYWQIKFSYDGKNFLAASANQEEYGHRLMALAYNLKNQVSFTTDQQDTIPLLDTYFQPTYSLSVPDKVLLIFERPESQHKGTLHMRIDEFGIGCGELEYKIRLKDIRKCPELKMHNPIN